MKKASFHIKPYKPALEPQLRLLEKEAEQGTFVKIEMIRSGFLSRSLVFENYQPYVAFNEQKQLIGTAIGAKVPLRLNGRDIWAGYAFDVKVSKKYRNQGIARRLGRHTIKNFFIPHQLSFQFITLKKTNSPVRTLAAHFVKKIHLYEFAYLSIPTTASIPHWPPARHKQYLTISLLSDIQKLEPFYTIDQSGLGIWWLDKLYKIKITHIHPLVKAGIWLKKHMAAQPVEYPEEGSELSSALLFNHKLENIQALNSILAKLREKGIQYLLVCCQPGDGIYDCLKTVSINTYGYYILSSQAIHKHDNLSLDVRCL